MYVRAYRIDGGIDNYYNVNGAYFGQIGRPFNSEAEGGELDMQDDYPSELVLNPNVYRAFVCEVVD